MQYVTSANCRSLKERRLRLTPALGGVIYGWDGQSVQL